MDLSNQKRMASQVMKCGIHRVYFNPNNIDEISEAVTRQDIRKLVDEGIIRAKQKKGISSGRKKKMASQKAVGKRKGHGSRKGSKYARFPRKRRWISTIRPIRRTLMEYRADGVISRDKFRQYYRHASGGMFRSVSHMKAHMEAEKAFLKTPAEEVK
ncbi:MAG: 50S ribosomal protein L19e [Thermoplasmatota archaeon]